MKTSTTLSCFGGDRRASRGSDRFAGMRARAILPPLIAIVALAVPGSGLGRETGPESGPETSASATGEIRLAVQFDNAELVTVVQAIAAGAGQRFLFDDRLLKGRVTITVSDRVTVPEALEILNAALLMKGFTAVAAPGGFRKIVPIQFTASEAPWSLEAPRRELEEVVTTLVRVHHSAPGRILEAIQPMLGKSILARVYEPTASLILAGPEARLHRLLTVVQALDQAQERSRMVLRLRYRRVEDLLPLVESAFTGEPQLELISDQRSNALVVVASATLLDEVRAFVRKLDRPEAGRGQLHIVPVLNARAEALAEILRQAGTSAGIPDTARGRAAELAERDYTIAVDVPTNSLLVRSDSETFRVLLDLVDELDRIPPAISVEALVVEVSTTETLDLSLAALIPFSGREGDGSLNVNGVAINTSGTSPLEAPPQGTVLKFTQEPLTIPVVTPSGETIAVTIPLRAGFVVAQGLAIYTRTLLNPHLVILSGEQQEIHAGDNIPIPAASTTDVENPLQIQQNIERQDIGVNLRVEPRVGQKGGVWLRLSLDVSRLAPSKAGDVDVVGPTIEQRTIEATFTLRDGELAVIGAHEQPSHMRVERRVPFLSAIPILGTLFKGIDEETLDNHLVIAVQARMLRTPEDYEAESIRRRLALERHLEGLAGLQEVTEAPYALLVTTRSLDGDAEAIAATLSGPDGAARVVAWDAYGRPRFDVYLTGFSDLAEVGEAALALRDRGWSPSVVVVPRVER